MFEDDFSFPVWWDMGSFHGEAKISDEGMAWDGQIWILSSFLPCLGFTLRETWQVRSVENIAHPLERCCGIQQATLFDAAFNSGIAKFSLWMKEDKLIRWNIFAFVKGVLIPVWFIYCYHVMFGSSSWTNGTTTITKTQTGMDDDDDCHLSVILIALIVKGQCQFYVTICVVHSRVFNLTFFLDGSL